MMMDVQRRIIEDNRPLFLLLVVMIAFYLPFIAWNIK